MGVGGCENLRNPLVKVASDGTFIRKGSACNFHGGAGTGQRKCAFCKHEPRQEEQQQQQDGGGGSGGGGGGGGGDETAPPPRGAARQRARQDHVRAEGDGDGDRRGDGDSDEEGVRRRLREELEAELRPKLKEEVLAEMKGAAEMIGLVEKVEELGVVKEKVASLERGQMEHEAEVQQLRDELQHEQEGRSRVDGEVCKHQRPRSRPAPSSHTSRPSPTVTASPSPSPSP